MEGLAAPPDADREPPLGGLPALRRANRRGRGGLLFWAGVTGGVLVVVLLAATTLLGWQATTARTELLGARTVVERARAAASAGDLPAAHIHLARLRHATAAAHHATDGVLWTAAARVPWVGDDVDAVRVLSSQLDVLAVHALPPLLDASTALRPAQLRARGDRVDVDALVRAQPALLKADAAVRRVRSVLFGVKRPGLMAPVGTALDEVRSAVVDLSSVTGTAAAAARVVPPLLGADRPRSYFLALQNPAEARGTGGLTGGYAIIDADRGAVRVRRLRSNEDLRPVRALPDFGRDFRTQFGVHPALWANANLSPHFPYAAQIMLAGIRQQSGERLDGVFATDPVALGYLLQASGPVTLPDGRSLDGAGAARLLMSGIYASYPTSESVPARDVYLQRAGQAMIEGVLSGRGEPAALARALARAVGEHRLLAYSADPRLQQEIAATPLGGALPRGDAPFLGVIVNQGRVNKLDYYLEREVTYRLGPCRIDGTRIAQAEVRFTNAAPRRGLPPYVAGLAPYAGHSRLLVSLHLTRGAYPHTVRVDGRVQPISVLEEQGRPVVAFTVDLAPGQSRDVTADLVEPARSGPAEVWAQPLARPQHSSVSSVRCDTPGH